MSVTWHCAALSSKVARAVNSRTFALAVLLASSVALAAGSLSQFPKKLGAPITGSAVAADLTGSGEPSVVVAAGGRVLAFTPDGRGITGFPIALGKDEEPVGDLAAADVDGDARADVAVTTKSGKLFLISKGAVAPGFPVQLAGACAAGPAFADLDGDGRVELLQGDSTGLLHAIRPGGKELPPFPLQLEGALTTSPSVGRLRGQLVIAVGSEKGAVYVVDTKGNPLAGFPLVTHFTVSGAPAFGDVDDDGEVDLVVTSRDFNLYAVNGEGKPLEGFPVASGMACYGPPALADLDGDDVLDIAFTSSEGQLWAVHGTGKSLPGFPVKFASSLLGGVAVADMNRDGQLDLVVAERDGLLHAVSNTGKPLGTPAKLGGLEPGTPFIGKLRDGSLIAFVGASEGNLAAVRFDSSKTTGPGKGILWAGNARDAARSGWYRPNPLRYKDLAISPKEPRVADALQASWTFFSVDAAPEPAPPVSWQRNGRRVKELDGKKEVPAGTARKGERWRFELQVGSRTISGPEVTVVDTPPTTPEVRVEPASPTVLGNARVVVATPAQDADGDKVTYRIAWLKDGQSTDLTSEVLPAARLKKGQRWTAVVTPFDGELEGKPGVVEALVTNSPPGAPVFAIQPKAPRKGDTIAAALQKPAKDPDADAVQYRYRWTVNGEQQNRPIAKADLPTDILKKHDQISVRVTAFDGTAEGEEWTGSVQMENTPPPTPKVAILPASPGTGQALRAVVAAPSLDADADTIAYRAAWTKNGKPFTPPGDAFEIPSAEVKKGDKWAVTVTPNDGEADGKPGSAEVTVRNTPPSSLWVGLQPERPTTGGGIELKILRASEDIDGDAVQYAYAWTMGGKPVGNAKDPKERARTAMAAKELRKHERIRVAVTPSDGTADGPVAETEVEVANAVPGAPVVALEPAVPTNQQPLKAVIRTPAPDTDGDALQYRYAWTKNGALQQLPEKQAELPASALVKGDRWSVSVRAWDGEVLGPAAGASVQVGNAAPPAPKVVIAPANPRRGQELRALITEVPDPDGDLLAYRFEWKRDGAPVSLAPGSAAVPREQPKKGERWSVDVIASDGEADSPRAHAEVKIANTPPTAPDVALCRGPVPAGAPLEVTLPAPSSDADGDPITYQYAWTVNGQPMAKWVGRKTLGAGDTKKHDKLRVTVTPSDGTENGPSTAAECEIEDSAPGAPKIAFDPAEPTAETGARATVTQGSEDRDGDKVTYRYAWTKNGLPFVPGGDGSAVKPGGLKRGDELTVVVTSFDGEREGGRASLSVRVKNTPPPAPALKLTPEQPVTGDKLTCAAKVAAADADGDPIQVRYRWSRNGEATAIAEDQPELPAGTVKKGEKWRCEVWSDEGFAVSKRVSAEVMVKNSAPPAPQVTIEPETATTYDELVCRIVGESKDPDGDPVKYRYAWTRNGKPAQPEGDPRVIAADKTSKGETWKCTVTPSDGAVDGPAVTVERHIANSPPGPARVSLGPQPPVPGKPLTCQLIEPAVDPDGDPVQYRFFWYRDGKEQGFAPISREAPGRMVKQKDLWSCEVQATDGQAEGPRSSSGAVVVP